MNCLTCVGIFDSIDINREMTTMTNKELITLIDREMEKEKAHFDKSTKPTDLAYIKGRFHALGDLRRVVEFEAITV